VITELFSLVLTVDRGTVKRNLSKSALSGGVGHFERKFRYNFAAGSFHTKKLKVCSNLLLTEVEFYWKKTAKSRFMIPFGGT